MIEKGGKKNKREEDINERKKNAGKKNIEEQSRYECVQREKSLLRRIFTTNVESFRILNCFRRF